MKHPEYKTINKSFRKKDSKQLLLGKPVYTNDVTNDNALVVKLMRSPHAHALVKNIDTNIALKVPGVEAIFTYKDVPQHRFTIAGQTYPELSPYDRLIIDRHLRFVGDVVAIIAAENEKAALKAMSLIKVEYEILDSIIDMHKALDNKTIIHPEDDWKMNIPVNGDNKRNLVASGKESNGPIDEVMDDCEIKLDRTYRFKPFQQAMMEPFTTYCEMDRYGRLHVVTSTQIIFHARRIIANALGIARNMIRVEKPRIGGGFGAKQTAVSEVYPAFVTYMTKKPSRLVFTREECQIAGSPRHEMEVRVKLGANRQGKIRALDVYTLSNTGAYSEHGPTTVGLSGHKAIPLYTGGLEAYRFNYDVVYTNVQSSGAYRGYGATQGIYAIESAVNELSEILNIDPTVIREMNMVKEGMFMPAFENEYSTANALDKCMNHCKDIFNWDEKYPVRDMGNGKIRSAGVAMAMQGSCIAHVDVASATVKLTDDGTYNLIIGAADMGTGCDTILSQMLCECMDCEMDDVVVFGADTDVSPYDSGSYASSTTYLTGKAVEKACEDLKKKICAVAADLLNCSIEEVVFESKKVRKINSDESVTLKEIGTKSQFANDKSVESSYTHSSPKCCPPFMVGMAEIELDKLTGQVEVLNYKAVIDCGIAINPALATIQAEGGIVQGIGHTLYEDVQYTEKGKPTSSSFLQYKIPSRLDINNLQIEFENSYEETGPFGAKSIGEIVINTPAPAITHAIYRATKVWHRQLPIKPEDIAMSLIEKRN